MDFVDFVYFNEGHALLAGDAIRHAGDVYPNSKVPAPPRGQIQLREGGLENCWGVTAAGNSPAYWRSGSNRDSFLSQNLSLDSGGQRGGRSFFLRDDPNERSIY